MVKFSTLPSTCLVQSDSTPGLTQSSLTFELVITRRKQTLPPPVASLGLRLGWPQKIKRERHEDFEVLPVQTAKGRKRYVWDGSKLQAVSEESLTKRSTAGDKLLSAVVHVQRTVKDALLPQRHEVTPDYWCYARWRATHRLFSSILSIFATQSLLAAVGVGAQRSLPAAAAINWVLKDGLGRMGRLGVAARFGQSFDADLKRFQFTTAVLYSAATALEYATPLVPQYFLPLAALANVGKSVGLTTHIATQPAFLKSFACGENLADINAKSQAQSMIMDTIGLSIAVTLTYSLRNSAAATQKLRLMAFPILVAGDLASILQELRAIHLRSLNKERAEILAASWLRSGRIPTAQQVSKQERLLLPSRADEGVRLQLCRLDQAVTTDQQLRSFLEQPRDQRYALTYRDEKVWWQPSVKGTASIALREDAQANDVLRAVLQVSYFRQLQQQQGDQSQHMDSAHILGPPQPHSTAVHLQQSYDFARKHCDQFVKAAASEAWQVSPFMLSSSERGSHRWG